MASVRTRSRAAARPDFLGRRFLRTWPLWAALIVGAGLNGCGTGNPFPPGSFERGEHFRRHGKHHEAVRALESFVRLSPTDSLAAQAQFLKALSYIELKEYPLAVVELQILRKDFPTSELVEEAFFREGEAHFRQVGSIERDVSGAYDARLRFQEFLRAYPDSRFKPEVQDYLQRISDLIVRKRLNAADVFAHLGRRDSVALVLDSLLAEETESSLLDVVLLRRARVAEKLGDPARAVEFYRRLIALFPDSPRTQKARSALTRLSAPAEP